MQSAVKKSLKCKCVYAGLLFVTLLLFGTVCSANEYEDNPNYQFLYYGSQGSNYLDLTSIVVNEYNPPKYEIGAVTVHVDTATGQTVSGTTTVRYNYDEQSAYSFNEWTQKWMRVENSDVDLVHERGVILVNAMFHAVYGINFFH